MKAAVLRVLVCAAAVMLASAGCNYAKRVMYLQVVNRSAEPMRNLEVTYPTGAFGLYELRNEETHRHMVPVGTPCKFRIAFEDQRGKAYASEFNLGSKCPNEIAFDVGEDLKVTERQVRP